MSTIAILGSGRVASGLALKMSSVGHRIIVGSRSPERPDWITNAIEQRRMPEAIKAADIAINATPGASSLERLSALRAELSGKILVDVSNAVERGEDGMPGKLTYPERSLAEHLQDALPATKIVKTLNTMLFTVMTAPDSLTSPATVFMSGNDNLAKDAVSQLLQDIGWAENHILDLGGIQTARGPESMILLVQDLIKARGFAPFALTVAT